MKKALMVLLIIIFFAAVAIIAIFFYEQKHTFVGRELIEKHYFNYVMKHGLHEEPLRVDAIPNEETAIKVAMAVFSPIFGEQRIKRQRPFEAYLISGYWVVCGTLPRNVEGSVPCIIISKKDGKVVHIANF